MRQVHGLADQARADHPDLAPVAATALTTGPRFERGVGLGRIRSAFSRMRSGTSRSASSIESHSRRPGSGARARARAGRARRGRRRSRPSGSRPRTRAACSRARVVRNRSRKSAADRGAAVHAQLISTTTFGWCLASASSCSCCGQAMCMRTKVVCGYSCTSRVMSATQRVDPLQVRVVVSRQRAEVDLHRQARGGRELDAAAEEEVLDPAPVGGVGGAIAHAVERTPRRALGRPDRERAEVRPEALRGDGPAGVALERPLDHAEVVVERPDLDPAQLLGPGMRAADEPGDRDVLVEELGHLGLAERVGVQRVHLAALDVRDADEDVAVVPGPAELAAAHVDLLARLARQPQAEEALGGEVDGAHVAGQARGLEVRLDELPLLERLEPVGGERERGVGRKPRAHEVVDRVAAGDEGRPVARDARLLAEHLGELVPAVAEPVALVDEVLVDVDPRRRVDRLGERAGT